MSALQQPPSTRTAGPCITRIEHGVHFSRVFITSSNRRSCCQDFELKNGSTCNSHPKNKNPKLSHWLRKGPASSPSKATASKKHVHLIWRDKDRHPTSIPEPFRLSPPYLVQQREGIYCQNYFMWGLFQASAVSEIHPGSPMPRQCYSLFLNIKTLPFTTTLPSTNQEQRILN